MKTNGTLGSLDLAQILALVFGPNQMDEILPPEAVAEGEVDHGTLESQVARRLYTAAEAVRVCANETNKEHEMLHECSATKPQLHDCEAFAEKMHAYVGRRNVLGSLFWRAVHEEHPQASVNSVGVRTDWKLVGLKGDLWTNPAPAVNPDSILDTLVVRISDAFNDQGTDAIVCPSGKPVAEGEKVAATVTDRRLQLLLNLKEKLSAERKTLLPLAANGADEAAFTQWFSSQRVNDLTGLVEKASAYTDAEHILTSIFWSCASDLVEGGHQKSNLVVREGWQIVETPKKRSSIFGGGPIVLPAGLSPSDLGMEGVEIELPVEILQLLMGRRSGKK